MAVDGKKHGKAPFKQSSPRQQLIKKSLNVKLRRLGRDQDQKQKQIME